MNTHELPSISLSPVVPHEFMVRSTSGSVSAPTADGYEATDGTPVLGGGADGE